MILKKKSKNLRAVMRRLLKVDRLLKNIKKFLIAKRTREPIRYLKIIDQNGKIILKINIATYIKPIPQIGTVLITKEFTGTVVRCIIDMTAYEKYHDTDVVIITLLIDSRK